MARDRKGTFMTLTPDAAAVLSGVENKSAFVSALVVASRSRALDALRWLDTHGVEQRFVASAAQAAGQGFRSGQAVRGVIGAELRHYPEVASAHGIEAREWADFCARLGTQESEALLAVADQVAAGDSEIERRLTAA